MAFDKARLFCRHLGRFLLVAALALLLQLENNDAWLPGCSFRQFLPRKCSLATSNQILTSPDAVSLSSTRQTGDTGFSSAIDASQDDSLANNFWSQVGAAVSVPEKLPLLLGVKSLGVDYGLVRTGLAVTVGYEPTPLAILSEFNATIPNATVTELLCEAIVSHAVAQHNVQRLIVGLPFYKNGTISCQTIRTVQFGQQLAATVLSRLGPEIPVFLFDERFTSKDAAARLHQRNPSRLLYGTLDSAAAGIILENYYQDGGIGAFPVILPLSIRADSLEQYKERQQQIEIDRQTVRQGVEDRLQRRQQAIEKDRAEGTASLAVSDLSEIDSTKRKKKKKKR